MSEIVSIMVSQFKQMHYFVSLHFLVDWRLKPNETATVKATVRVKEEREGPVCKKDKCGVKGKVI